MILDGQRIAREAGVCFREHRLHTVQEPFDLLRASQEHTAQDRTGDSLRMGLRVGQGSVDLRFTRSGDHVAAKVQQLKGKMEVIL